METKEIDQQIKPLVQTLIDKGYLNSKGGTSSDDFAQQFRQALTEILENPNPRLNKRPAQERFEWIDVESRMMLGAEKLLFNFRYTFFPQRQSLALGEVEVGLPGKPATAFLAADDYLQSPEEYFVKVGGPQLRTNKTPKKRSVDPPTNLKKPGL